MARNDPRAAGLKIAATLHRITTHPGVVLAEALLKPLGLSVNALAMALRVPATRMGAVVKGEPGGDGRHGLAAGALLWHQPGVLGQPPGDA